MYFQKISRSKVEYQNQSPAIVVDAIKKSNEGIDQKNESGDKSDIEGSKSIKVQRSNSKISPERPSRTQKLRRQATAFDDTLPILPFGEISGDNQISPDTHRRRDSLSPDNILTHTEEETSPKQRNKLQSHSSSNARDSRSLESSSCCSSRDASPCPKIRSSESIRQTNRRQSTTEEILIARGFRRQSTTEEMIRCRNFRRQSSQSDDVCRLVRISVMVVICVDFEKLIGIGEEGIRPLKL